MHPIDMRRMPVHPANLIAARKLRGLIQEILPDVVHGHSSVGGALARISAVGTQASAFYTPNGIPPGRLSRLIERLLGRLTTTFVAVSPSEATRAVDWKLVPPDRVAVVPNGIDLFIPDGHAPDIRDLAGIPAGVPLVGTVMRLVPQKAPELFVAVCAEVARARRDTHFLLIGLGPMQDTIDRKVSEAGLGDRWHQIPHLPEAAAALSQLDVFTLMSAFEGGPYTPLEAIRAGVPVVLTDVVGNRDVVEPGVSGIVAPFGDVRALAQAVIELLDDPAKAEILVRAARRRLEDRFDLNSMGVSMTDLYRLSARASSLGSS